MEKKISYANLRDTITPIFAKSKSFEKIIVTNLKSILIGADIPVIRKNFFNKKLHHLSLNLLVLSIDQHNKMESTANEQNTNQSGSNFDWDAEQQLQLENLSPEEKQRRLDALNRSDNPADDNLNDHAMEQDKDEGNWIQVARSIRRYKASINIMNISENNTQQKLRIV